MFVHCPAVPANHEPVRLADLPTAAEPEADLARSGRPLLETRDAQRALGGPTAEELVAVVESASAPLAHRHAAGLRLALVGDPRVHPFDPVMIDVPGGPTWIGLPAAQVGRVIDEWGSLGVLAEWIDKEVPRHEVLLAPYRIGRYPVTNEQWLAFVLDHPAGERPSSWAHGCFPLGRANQPVYTVSPDGADEYAAWLAGRTGRRFRLPTEAEWEHAATGGDGREYPWGDRWDSSRANTAEAGLLTTTPVGMYPTGASAFGVLDLAGNVEEYVADLYRPYPGARVIADDLIATYGDDYRVARGGSFARHGDLARCARRHGWYHSAHYAMGFRLAEDVDVDVDVAEATDAV